MGSCEVKVPHSLDAILNIADDRSLIGKRLEDLIHDLHAGVSLKGIKEKYWVHMITGANAFELYARDLLIEHADVKYHWSWKTEDNIEVAELVQVHWLDVKTNFPAQMLTPRTSYEVLFVLRRNEKAKELTNSNLKLVLPNQNASEVTVDLSTLPTNEWKEIQVGGFETSSR
ncbi:protein PHLOEM PROTEIN 2-LIKE A1-like [Mangifera indica]|uniref:protein PHLOEM PROTEIN 2-LIKE A1-like n=1 Tax=Mangifera indica TaxID=29780 RepID=UPI001CFBE18C|nr:protein PHLOEM PROTEIN 2-LIKE A1-like [Mangifera indica]